MTDQARFDLDLTPPSGPLSPRGWKGAATFSPCGKYRYDLVREWPDGHGLVLGVMANPSKANHLKNDNTVAKMCGYVRAERAKMFVVCNLCAFIATDPQELVSAQAQGMDVVGPDNDATIAKYAAQATRIIVGWGAFSWARQRALQVCSDGGPLQGRQLECLAITSDGAPGHPLYLPSTAKLQPYPIDELKRWANRERKKK